MTKELRKIKPRKRPFFFMEKVLKRMNENSVNISSAMAFYCHKYDIHDSTAWKYKNYYEKNINQ